MNNASEPEKSINHLSSGRFISQRATKSEPRGSAVILDPALTFNPRETTLRNKGNFTCGVFHLKDKERGKLGEKLRKRPALMRKKK